MRYAGGGSEALKSLTFRWRTDVGDRLGEEGVVERLADGEALVDVPAEETFAEREELSGCLTGSGASCDDFLRAEWRGSAFDRERRAREERERTLRVFIPLTNFTLLFGVSGSGKTRPYDAAARLRPDGGIFLMKVCASFDLRVRKEESASVGTRAKGGGRT